jgi:rhamnopyranosyl-N-acetylglucosaminyl-diphospho-decaprenol beta-1,3/1,4-galactofuranosyltransferase
MGEKERIAAVIVTYNRKELLGPCLDSVLSQTMPLDSIVVIDNASTDGTPDFLRDAGYLGKKAVDYARMLKNIGGAGGFYEGTKRAYESGFDWFWLMDDDAIADRRCLENMINNGRSAGAMVLSPLVVDKDGKNLLSFDVYDKNRGKLLKNAGDAEGSGKIFETTAVSFNGILINRAVAAKIGFPRKEFFIWSDDVEYSLRIVKNGFKINVVPQSIFYHPRFMNRYKKIMGGIFGSMLVGSELYFYCRQRNYAVIMMEYKGFLATACFMAKEAIKIFFYSLQERNFAFLKLALFAFYHAIGKRFGYEQKFLKP